MKVKKVFKNKVIKFYDDRLRVSDFTEKVTLNYELLYPNHDDLDDILIIQKCVKPELATDLLVCKIGDKHILINGHHTAASLILKGKTELDCLIKRF